QFSLENPETTLTPNGGGPRITSGSGVIPDAVARYNFESSGGAKFALAGIARQLKIDQANLDDNTLGYGVSFSGVVPVGKDDFKFTATYGDGLGRYLALNFANGGVVNNSGDIETIKSYAGFAAYRHWWNEQWRSSVTVSGFKADNQLEYTGGAANKEAYSANINLLYSPIKPLTVGVEYMYASNGQESGYDGSLDRILFSAKYML
ncbi:MAG: DcaP family trimeric outer membrane transporter, partial [Shewanella sp.]